MYRGYRRILRARSPVRYSSSPDHSFRHLKRSFQEPYFSFEGIRPFRYTAACIFQRSYYLMPPAPVSQQVMGAPTISGPVVFRDTRFRNVSFRTAAYRGIQSSCHKKGKGKDRSADARLSLYSAIRIDPCAKDL